MEIHKSDIYGSVALAGNEGILGQVLTSAGPNAQATWANSNLSRLYFATDKVAQLSVIGASDLTWNQPPADAQNGITLDSVTSGSAIAGVTINLPANRTFQINAYIKPTVAALAYTVTITDTSNVPIGSLNLPVSALANLNLEIATAWFRPLVATKIKVRLSGGVGLTIGSISRIVITSED